MPSLRESPKLRSAPTSARSRSSSAPTSARSRPSSAPARISLNKEVIVKMNRTEARATLRATTPMSFFKMGQRGLVLFALLLIQATQPSQAYRAGPPAVMSVSAPIKTKHWMDAFRAKETGAATQIARDAAAIAVAATTGSGTATTAILLSQFTSSAYGKYIIIMAIIAFMIQQILSYGKARMNRQTAKNQMAFMSKQLEAQQKMLQMMLNAQMAATPGRGRRRTPAALPSANRLALLTAN